MKYKSNTEILKKQDCIGFFSIYFCLEVRFYLLIILHQGQIKLRVNVHQCYHHYWFNFLEVLEAR